VPLRRRIVPPLRCCQRSADFDRQADAAGNAAGDKPTKPMNEPSSGRARLTARNRVRAIVGRWSRSSGRQPRSSSRSVHSSGTPVTGRPWSARGYRWRGGRDTRKVLELDHLFCFVDPTDGWADRLAEAGWLLDPGAVHAGQGTRNRRLFWPEQYLELLWVTDADEAARNPLRLDRRADWIRTGASPFGIGLRGQVPGELADDYWLYADLGIPLWIHRNNERYPEQPFLFVHQTDPGVPEQLRPRTRVPELVGDDRTTLTEVRLSGPAPASVPGLHGPDLCQSVGPHRMELLLDPGKTLSVNDLLTLTAGTAQQPTQ
jgi:hypothetical protein